MTRLDLRWSAFVFIALTACSPTETEQAGHFRGTMRSSCAPHDALSTVFDLAAVKSEATVHLNLWPPYDASPSAVLRFSEPEGGGLGSFCSAPGECVAASWGEVRLEPGGPAITGSWSLGFADGAVFSGTFDAEWLLNQSLCG